MAVKEKSLVIVESPSKAKTINKYLGSGYKVTASVGHIIDLPKTKFGVNIEDGFKPQYIKIRGKEKLIKQLQADAAGCDRVFLATDPDREGEAIAFHIASILEKKNANIQRIEFNEITKNAVTTALDHPRTIDMARVYSQQARRVLDRIVGYEVSPILWKTVYRGLSAGRVQSVALRLVCEREELIRAFVAEEFWTIKLLAGETKPRVFWSRLVKIRDSKSGKFIEAKIGNETDANRHIENIRNSEINITGVDRKKVNRKASPPFITSTLQQTAARVLRMSTSKIMRVAQQLYEGIDIPGQGSVGLITYMRTDSTRLSKDSVDAARELVSASFGEQYLPAKPVSYQTKKNAQDAHEAIRPTYISPEFSPQALKNSLAPDQFKVYDLIWKRFIACQMKPAQFDKTTVEITASDYQFRAEGEVLTFEGYLKVYGHELENPEDFNEENFVSIPEGLQANTRLDRYDDELKQNFTKPPARYTESTLVKELDKQGIGRPSTYAQIITTIVSRKYAEKKEGKLFATELGETVNKILVQHFPKIFSVKFTAELEEDLDKIATDNSRYEDVLQEFYTPFKSAMEKAQSQKDQIKSELLEEAGENCENCGKPMVIRWGRNGRFMACSGYPECKTTKPLEEPDAPTVSDEKCDKCGKPMLVKSGRYGKFLACSDYPACKNAKPIPSGVKCPKDGCDGDIIERRSKRGKTFYGCSRYPKCDFVSWNKPVNKKCEQCGNNYIEEKYTKAKGNFLQCPECKTVITTEGTPV